MSEKRPQSFRADPIFLGHLREKAKQHGLSLSDLVVRYLKIAYKLHQKHPDILGLGSPVKLEDIPENEVREAASQGLFQTPKKTDSKVEKELIQLKEEFRIKLQEKEKEREKEFEMRLQRKEKELDQKIKEIPLMIERQIQAKIPKNMQN